MYCFPVVNPEFLGLAVGAIVFSDLSLSRAPSLNVSLLDNP